MSLKGVALWRQTVSQTECLLIIGMLALLLTLGFAGSLFAEATSQPHAAGLHATPHSWLAPAGTPIIRDVAQNAPPTIRD
jgi:hypothetical protein